MGLEQQVQASVGWLGQVPGEHRGTFERMVDRRHLVRWERPGIGWLKCNVDGAVSLNLEASCGGALRDSSWA